MSEPETNPATPCETANEGESPIFVPGRAQKSGQSPRQRAALDEAKRTRILALVASGCSRRVAARFVGCAPSTITRTAQRDEQFAAQLARAEQTADVDIVHCLRNAAREPRYWRAGAWLLERRNPDDFSLQSPMLFTAQQMGQIVYHTFDEVMKEVAPEVMDRMLARFRKLLRGIQELELTKREWETGDWVRRAMQAADDPDAAQIAAVVGGTRRLPDPAHGVCGLPGPPACFVEIEEDWEPGGEPRLAGAAGSGDPRRAREGDREPAGESGTSNSPSVRGADPPAREPCETCWYHNVCAAAGQRSNGNAEKPVAE